ncbi:hypothetical protein FF38_08837 [Lucilia cuprina]|uniref:HAT C-terminal dimerisation domain-containing protein n=1 Tax=Lucilia cuprina TaxID=7375 RepID=A0A0L0CBE9_LUCCU|nr:hypothetical protein FF38_08837 [Lucilia cuprina]
MELKKEIFNVSVDLIDAINSQYSNISYVKWTENTSATSFWSEVNLFKDSAGNNSFKDLAKFAIEMLSLPWSNADLERVFSQLNVVETKLRNRLITDTVNAVLHVSYLSLKYIFIPFTFVRRKTVYSWIGWSTN